MLFLFVLWQGIYDPGQTQEKDGDRGFILYHPNLLCCLDQMLAMTELSQHLVSSSQTVRPIIPCSAQCMRHVKILLSAVCSLVPHSHFAEEARPHLCMDEPERPTPVHRRLSLTQAVLVKLIPIWSCADPRNVDTEHWHTFGVLCVPCQVRPLGSANAQLR